MKVLFFGRLADAVGPELEVAARPGCSVAELRDGLVARHPEIASVLRNRRARTCVGDRLVHDDYRLNDGDILEFMPPVSGG